MVNTMYSASDKPKDSAGSKHKGSAGSKHNQVLMSIVVCMPVLAYGAAMGWLSPHKALLMGQEAARGRPSPAAPPLTEEQVSWLASVMFLSAPAAVFAHGWAADRFGRKRALLAATVPIAAGWAVKLCGGSAAALVCARALLGWGAGGAYVVCPLYVREISDDRIRGMTGTFIIFSQTVGNLVVFVVGDLLPYRAVLWTLLALPLLHAALMLRLPDSPAYLLQRGDLEECARAVGWLRSLPPGGARVREEVARLARDQLAADNTFSPRLLFSERLQVKAFCVSLAVNLAREFCGAIAVLVYASHVFAAAGAGGAGGLTPNQQSVVLAAVQIVGSFVACQLVDRAGRKPLLAVTSLVAGASMLTLGACFYPAAGAGAGAGAAGGARGGWLPAAALCCAIFADAAGLQPLPFVIMTEMFSFQLRGTAATLVTAVSLATDFALLKLFAPLIAAVGYHYTFWMFSAVCLANVLYVVVYVPETSRRTLADIYADLQARPQLCCRRRRRRGEGAGEGEGAGAGSCDVT